LWDTGITAEMDFACCNSCGHHELSQGSDRYIFWHGQDEDSFDGDRLTRTLNIRFSDATTAAEVALIVLLVRFRKNQNKEGR
jgi:hypothetical protein